MKKIIQREKKYEFVFLDQNEIKIDRLPDIIKKIKSYLL